MAQQRDDFERRKLEYELVREDAIRVHDRAKDFEDKTNEATINAAQVALRTAVLINGGAAVAVLAFIGGLVGQKSVGVAQAGIMARTLIWFAFGVAAASAALGLSYFTHLYHAQVSESRIRTWDHPYLKDGPSTSKWLRWANVFHWAAIAVGALSLVLFVIGMFAVRNGIKHLG